MDLPSQIADILDGVEIMNQRLCVLETRILALNEYVDDDTVEHEQGMAILNGIRNIKENLSKSKKDLEKIYYWRLAFIAANLLSLASTFFNVIRRMI